jgi:PST family polysaccharide transporter
LNGSGGIYDDMFAFLTTTRETLLKNKILVENFTFLSVLQISNFILFIITVPYLFRVVGSSIYGLIVFAQTIVFYFSIFINFGFNLTATRDVSVNRNDKKKLSEIFSAVTTIKLVFLLISLAAMVVLSSTLPDLREHQGLYLFSMLAALSEALFPVWFFQGIEKMKYITFSNVLTRVVATVFVFVLIRSGSDYMLYPVILGIGTLSGAITGIFIMIFRYRVFYNLPSIRTLVFYIKENTLYFFSNISTQLYLNANKLIIGAFLGMKEVAFYDVADKVVNIARVPLSILGQTLFPRVSVDKNIKKLKRIMGNTVIFTCLVVIIIIIFASFIIQFMSGTLNIESVNVLRILSLSLVPISVGIFYGDLLLVNFGLKVQYAYIRFLGFLFYLLFSLIVYSFFNIGIMQSAIITLLTEIMITYYSRLVSKQYLVR